jgi:hypothetical protein
MCRDRFDKACLAGGLKNIDLILEERIRRLGDLAQKMKPSFEWLEDQGDAPEAVLTGQHRLYNQWASMEFELRQAGWTEDREAKESFLSVSDHLPVGGGYVETIQAMESQTQEAGRQWLKSIINGVAGLWPAGTG